MSITTWRIVWQKHAATAFSGMGSKYAPGRWHRLGTPIVYTSATLSLAVLEILVRIDEPGNLESFVAIPATFKESQCKILNPKELPPDWANHPPSSSMDVGSSWAQRGKSLVLRVPSCIVPTEFNYLINPAHEEFETLQIGKPQPIIIDPRLLKGWR